MRRNEVLETLRFHWDELSAMGVRSLSLFGSVARDEATVGSDVDLIIDVRRPMGLFQFFKIQHFLEDLLGVQRVDLIERSAIHPALKSRILSEAVDVS